MEELELFYTLEEVLENAGLRLAELQAFRSLKMTKETVSERVVTRRMASPAGNPKVNVDVSVIPVTDLR
ncbi:hypothetical protein TIFTF001_006934 [Ficus carica]|uniref:Uncharacterized protein n=1 Tax=Ficus carica TaxID=3494 RepID=A0AA88ACA2_FICCA|nr:hypothetical protein TIFTF001_006934 [Ficus carica]